MAESNYPRKLVALVVAVVALVAVAGFGSSLKRRRPQSANVLQAVTASTSPSCTPAVCPTPPTGCQATTVTSDCTCAPFSCQSPSPTPPPLLPIGYLNGVKNGSVYGWACDADNFSIPISIYLYYDAAGLNLLGSGNLLADQPRELAVATQCGGYPNHGFVLATPSFLKDGKSHTIYAQVVDYGNPVGVDKRLWLSGSPITVTISR